MASLLSQGTWHRAAGLGRGGWTLAPWDVGLLPRPRETSLPAQLVAPSHPCAGGEGPSVAAPPARRAPLWAQPQAGACFAPQGLLSVNAG